MARNDARHLFSNGRDARVTVFEDGRVKVWSTAHLWEVGNLDRHTALGQFVELHPGRPVHATGGTEKATIIPIDPNLGTEVAGTVGMSNGSFVYFLHSGSVVVGNDTRDIARTFNASREETGGSVMVTFASSMKPRTLREFDHFVEVPELRKPVANRLYAGEQEIHDGKVIDGVRRGS